MRTALMLDLLFEIAGYKIYDYKVNCHMIWLPCKRRKEQNASVRENNEPVYFI